MITVFDSVIVSNQDDEGGGGRHRRRRRRVMSWSNAFKRPDDLTVRISISVQSVDLRDSLC